MNTLSVPVPPPLLLTVTPRVAVAVRPAPSRTVRPSVCAPSATVVVFHANVAVVAVPAAVKTCAPSTVSVKVIGVPDAPVSLMPTLTVPLTVALAAGLVNAAVSVDVVPFFTTKARVPVPTCPAESRTVAVSVCGPSATLLLSQASVAWLLAVPVASTVSPMLSVNVFDVPT
jgi:hypothetical protein